MAIRYYGSWTGFDGALYEIMIDDRDYVGTETTEFKIEAPFPQFPSGFLGLTEMEPIRDVELVFNVSSCPENMFDEIEAGREDQFEATIWRNTEWYWRGYVQHGTTERNWRDPYNSGTFKANDMGYLNDIYFTQDGTQDGPRYEGLESYANILGKCFAKLADEPPLAMGSDLFYEGSAGPSIYVNLDYNGPETHLRIDTDEANSGFILFRSIRMLGPSGANLNISGSGGDRTWAGNRNGSQIWITEAPHLEPNYDRTIYEANLYYMDSASRGIGSIGPGYATRGISGGADTLQSVYYYEFDVSYHPQYAPRHIAIYYFDNNINYGGQDPENRVLIFEASGLTPEFWASQNYVWRVGVRTGGTGGPAGENVQGGAGWSGKSALDWELHDQSFFYGPEGPYKVGEVIKQVMRPFDCFAGWDGGRYLLAPFAYLAQPNPATEDGTDARLIEYDISAAGATPVAESWFDVETIADRDMFIEPTTKVTTQPPLRSTQQSYDYYFYGDSPSIFLNPGFNEQDSMTITWDQGTRGTFDLTYPVPKHWETDVIGPGDDYSRSSAPMPYAVQIEEGGTRIMQINVNRDALDLTWSPIWVDHRRGPAVWQDSGIGIFSASSEAFLGFNFSYSLFDDWVPEDGSIGHESSWGFMPFGKSYANVSDAELNGQLAVSMEVETTSGSRLRLRRYPIYPLAQVGLDGSEVDLPVSPIPGVTNSILVPKGAELYGPYQKITLSKPFRYNDEVLSGKVEVVDPDENWRYREGKIDATDALPALQAWEHPDELKKWSYFVTLVWTEDETMTWPGPDGTPINEYIDPSPTRIIFPTTNQEALKLVRMYAPLFDQQGNKVEGEPYAAIYSPTNVAYKPSGRPPVRNALPYHQDVTRLLVNFLDLVYQTGEAGNTEGETILTSYEGNTAVERIELPTAEIGEGPTTSAQSAVVAHPSVRPDGYATGWYEAPIGPDGQFVHSAVPAANKASLLELATRRRLRLFKRAVRVFQGVIHRRKTTPFRPYTRIQPAEWAGSNKYLIPWNTTFSTYYNTLTGTFLAYDLDDYSPSADPPWTHNAVPATRDHERGGKPPLEKGTTANGAVYEAPANINIADVDVNDLTVEDALGRILVHTQVTDAGISAEYDGSYVITDMVDHVSTSGVRTSYELFNEPELPAGYTREPWARRDISPVSPGTTGFALTNSGEVAINEALRVRVKSEREARIELSSEGLDTDAYSTLTFGSHDETGAYTEKYQLSHGLDGAFALYHSAADKQPILKLTDDRRIVLATDDTAAADLFLNVHGPTAAYSDAEGLINRWHETTTDYYSWNLGAGLLTLDRTTAGSTTNILTLGDTATFNTGIAVNGDVDANNLTVADVSAANITATSVAADNLGTAASRNLHTGPAAPATPEVDDIWIDTSTSPYTIKIWDGTAWSDGTAAPA